MDRPTKLEIYAILLTESSSTPPFKDNQDTLGVLVNSYDAMAQRLFEDAARRAVEIGTLANRESPSVPSRSSLRLVNFLLNSFMQVELNIKGHALVTPSSVDVFAISPSPFPLAGSSYAFYDQASVNYNYERGVQDAIYRGFTRFANASEFCYLG